MEVNRNGQGKILSPEELKLLFTEGLTSPRDRALFAICLFTGCRISEALALQTSDIKSGTITFRKSTTKGKLKICRLNTWVGEARGGDRLGCASIREKSNPRLVCRGCRPEYFPIPMYTCGKEIFCSKMKIDRHDQAKILSSHEISRLFTTGLKTQRDCPEGSG